MGELEPSKEEIFQAFDALDGNERWKLIEFHLIDTGNNLIDVQVRFRIKQEEIENENEEDW